MAREGEGDKRIKENLHHPTTRSDICIQGSDATGWMCLCQEMGDVILYMMLGGKWYYIRKGALGGLCFHKRADFPAAFPPGDNPVYTTPKPESTDISVQPKPREPMTRRDFRWTRGQTCATSRESRVPCAAKRYGSVSCKITSCFLLPVWLQWAHQRRLGFPFPLIWPPVSLRFCIMSRWSAKNEK